MSQEEHHCFLEVGAQIPFPTEEDLEKTAWPSLTPPLWTIPRNRSRDRRIRKAAKPDVYPTSRQPLRQAFPSRQCCQCHPGSQVPGKQSRAQLPGGRTACLAHQLVPRDCAEEGMRLQLCYATSSRAQAPFWIVLQELSEQRCSSQAEALWQVQLGVRLNP